MKTESNSYTLVYSTVMVIIVAFLLAFVYQALKPMQDANVVLDKKKQILYSLNIRGLDDASVEAKYKEVIKGVKYIDAEDSLYLAEIDGKPKYIIPMKGMGLWAGISGLIAINEDKSTVFGAYFDHESETAGLGAEIKDNLEWQEKFQGKHLFANDKRDQIALQVIKKVDNPETQVDAVTGATLTSNGVTNMFKDHLTKYIKFFNKK